MSEMEDLKKNAEMALHKQRADEVHKYLVYLIDETLRLGLWHSRCSALTLLAFLGYWIAFTIALFADLPDEVRRGALDLHFIVIVVAWAREAFHHRRWRETEGEWKGAVTVLRKMGVPLPEDDGDKKRKSMKRESPFKRFKEFFERMKSKDKMNAYA